MHLALRLAGAPLQGEASFHRIGIFFPSGSKALKFRDALVFHPIEPLIQALALSLPQHGRELLDHLRGLGNLPIFLAEPVEAVVLPVQALPFLKSHPKSDLASRGRPFFLDFLRATHGRGFRFDRLEAASLPMRFSQRTHKAANRRRRARISWLVNLTIHLLSAAPSLIPSLDEIVFGGIDEPLAFLIDPRPLGWLLHLKGVRDRLAASPQLASHVGHIHLFRGQSVDLVREFDTLLMQALTLFFAPFGHCGIPRGWLRWLTPRRCFSFRLTRQRLE